LLQLVIDADEEMMGKLIELAARLQSSSERFTPAELQKFHASRQQYNQNPETGMSVEEAHTYIRSLKQK
jgi:hypothetical protein